jgi:uroporphyrinogen-III synthase
MADGALCGVGVLVTRPAEQADGLCRLIEEAGGEAIACPLLEIAPSVRLAEARKKFAALDETDWLVFVSANAVRYAQTLWDDGIMRISARPRIAAIGRATAKAVDEAGFRAAAVAPPPFDSEALLTLDEFRDVAGQRILLVRGEGGRGLLAETLRARGAQVEIAEVYRRVAADVDAAAVVARWRRNPLIAAAITSGEILERFVAVFAPLMGTALLETPLAVIGERVRQAAHRAGFGRVVAAAEAADAALLQALVRCMNRSS